MTSRLVVLLSSASLLAAGALPATAGERWQLYRHHDRHWHTVHRSKRTQRSMTLTKGRLFPALVPTYAA
jgi:hypothetical protein